MLEAPRELLAWARLGLAPAPPNALPPEEGGTERFPIEFPPPPPRLMSDFAGPAPPPRPAPPAPEPPRSMVDGPARP